MALCTKYPIYLSIFWWRDVLGREGCKSNLRIKWNSFYVGFDVLNLIPGGQYYSITKPSHIIWHGLDDLQSLPGCLCAEDAPSRSCVEAGWPLLSQEDGLLRSPLGSLLQQSKEALTVPLLVGVNRGLQFPAILVPNLQQLQRGGGEESQRKVQSKECKEFCLSVTSFWACLIMVIRIPH